MSNGTPPPQSCRARRCGPSARELCRGEQKEGPSPRTPAQLAGCPARQSFAIEAPSTSRRHHLQEPRLSGAGRGAYQAHVLPARARLAGLYFSLPSASAPAPPNSSSRAKTRSRAPGGPLLLVALSLSSCTAQLVLTGQDALDHDLLHQGVHPGRLADPHDPVPVHAEELGPPGLPGHSGDVRVDLAARLRCLEQHLDALLLAGAEPQALAGAKLLQVRAGFLLKLFLLPPQDLGNLGLPNACLLPELRLVREQGLDHGSRFTTNL